MTRYISIAHKLTGWNAIKDRAEQLGLELTDTQIKLVTQEVKALADIKPMDLNDVDELLQRWSSEDGSDPVLAANQLASIATRLSEKQAAANGKQLVKQPL